MHTTWKYVALSLVASAGLLSCSPPPFACTDEGTANCDGDTTNGCEVTLGTDPANCGECGTSCAAAANATGICTDGACGIACSDGFKNCDNGAENGCEVDVRVTVAHCGACGQACVAPANAVATCGASECGFTCNEGFADCDEDASNGCEVDTRTNADHCSACDNACADVAGGTGTCAASTCGFECDDDHGDCDGNAANGCESDLRVDAEHCGSCETACAVRDNSAPTCAAKSCGIDCGEGFDDCDENQANGCEVSLVDNLDHCGACGNACVAPEHAVPVCDGTNCDYACVEGFDDCDGSAANGCEVELAASIDHCNACNNACAATVNAAPTCTVEGCSFSCNDGFGNCSDAPGCETNLVGNEEHCNACGNACTAGPHAVPVCNTEGCDYECETGFADCDGQAGNGCEIDTRVDPLNCGGCSVEGSFACPARGNATATCAASQCGSACNAGFGNCDAIADNGCEEPLNTVDSCGTCDTTCAAPANAAAACNVAAGVASCGLTCNTGFGNCDGQAANGCEIPLDTSLNCGTCGNACPATVANGSSVCAAGSCAITCGTGFGSCDSDTANGCESEFATSAAHCGACGNACGTDRTCLGGACTGCALELAATVPVSGPVFTYSGTLAVPSRLTGYSCQASAAGGELIFKLNVPAGGRRYTAFSRGSLDTVLAVRTYCSVATSGVTGACDDDSGTGTSSRFTAALPEGEQFVIVDQYGTGTPSGGAVSVVIQDATTAPNALCTPPAEGPGGALALTTTPVLGQNLFGGTTSGGASCVSSYAGGQLFYSVTVPPGQRASIRATPQGATSTVLLRLRADCAASTCLTNSSATSALGDPAQLVVNNPGTDPRTVIVSAAGRGGDIEEWGLFDIDLALSPIPVVPNLTCAAPTVVAAGTPVTGDTNDASAAYPGAACLPTLTGSVLFYSVTVPAFTVGRVSVQPLTAGGTAGGAFDANIRVVNDCTALTCVASADSGGAGVGEQIALANDTASPVTRIVAVGGPNPFAGGSFRFSFDTIALAPNRLCSAPAALSNNVTTTVDLTSSLAGFATAPCLTSKNGRTLFYNVTVPAASVVVLSARAIGTPAVDVVLRAISACDATTCDASSDASTTAVESISLTNTTLSPVTRLVALSSGSLTTQGQVELTPTATLLPPETQCASAPALPLSTVVEANLALAIAAVTPQPTPTTTCTSAAGRAVYYSATVPAGQMLTVNAASDGVTRTDIALRILDACGAASCLAGSNVSSSSGVGEIVRFANTTAAPQPVIIAVSAASLTGTHGPVSIRGVLTPAFANTTCANARALTGESVLFNQDPMASVSPATQTGCASMSGTALWYSVPVPAGKTLSVRATPQMSGPTNNAGWNPVIRMATACATTCVNGSTESSSSQNAPEAHLYTNAGAATETVLVGVGSSSATITGLFDLEVRLLDGTAATLPAPDCAGAVPVTNGSITYGSTATTPSNVAFTTCSVTSGNGAVFYSATVPAGHRINARAFPLSGWNPRVHISETCASDTCLAGKDDTSTSVPEAAEWVNTRPDPVSVLITVSSASTTVKGAFALRTLVGPRPYATAEIPAACDDLSAVSPMRFMENDDDAPSMVMALPFALSFFGEDYGFASIQTNGVLNLHSSVNALSNSTFSNSALPIYTPPNGILAPFWDDLYPPTVSTTGSTARMSYLSAAPDPHLTFEWRDYRFGSTSSDSITFQTKLFPNGKVEFHYCATAGTGTNIRGSGATIGIESFDGSQAVQISRDTASATPLTGYRLTPAAP